MERVFFLLVFLLSTYATIFAQKSKVTSAIIAYDQQDYLSALDILNKALLTPASLREEELAEAYFYKGKTLIGLYMQASMSENADALKTYEMAFADAIECFVKTNDLSLPEKYAGELSLHAKQAYNFILSMAVGHIQRKELDKALRFADCAEQSNRHFVKENAYRVQNLYGKVHLALGDSAKALSYFQEELKSYAAAPPSEPDYYSAYTFYSLAMLQYYFLHNIDAALKETENGLAFLEKEHGRDAVREASEEDFYQMAKKDLQNFQLQVYMDAPDKMAEALQKFETAVHNDPENTAVRMVYASLLESHDPNAAIAQYEKVIALEPQNGTALYNLGALYYMRGAGYSNQALETEDDTRFSELQLLADTDFKKAYPLFQRALEITPDDYFILRALVQISVQLDREKDYVKYKEMMTH